MTPTTIGSNWCPFADDKPQVKAAKRVLIVARIADMLLLGHGIVLYRVNVNNKQASRG